MEIPREIFVGLAGAGLVGLPRWIWSKLRGQHFRKIFGEAKEYYLAFGSMAVRPDLLALAQACGRQDIARFPLAKGVRPELAFSAESVASGCEIRAVAYVGSTLSKEGGISARVVTDESIKDKVDADLISFGAMSNLRTLAIFDHAANRLARYDSKSGFFVSRKDDKPLYERRDGFDYGIIVKIHPSQFPARTWVCCAGWGEWGTSGTAWYLANKWQEIAKKVESSDQFLCVIEVRQEQDESATLLDFRVQRNPQ